MNFKTFWKSRGFKSWFCAFVPVFALILTIVLLLTCNSFLYQTMNGVFGSERRVLLSGDSTKYQYYQGDYNSKTEVLNAANAFNEEIAEEGTVLLKNENGALPVAERSRVTVFGKNASSLVLGGSGSNASSGGGTVRTVYDSLDAANLVYNPEMKSFYEDSRRSGDGRPASPDMNSAITGLTGFPTGETPASGYDEAARTSWKEYNDVALVIVSRIGGEGFDLPRSMFWDGSGYQNWEGDRLIPGARNKDDHYLQLDANETDMIAVAAENFDKVVVVLNSPTAMELGFLDDETHYAFSDKIKACLWIGTPGNTGIMSLGRILTGAVNPSGRTADTYARDFKTDPTWNNFGNNLTEGGNQYRDESGEKRNAYFVHYSEGIYVGYRYWETRGFVEAEKGNASWYDDNVVFPFGYGMSYTSFDWNVTQVSQSGTLDPDGRIDVTVEVTNNGSRAGKDVVQLYYSAPYDSVRNIEKSHVVLGDFAKTEEIPAGESATVTLSLNPRDMASYDYGDANGNGFAGYELEAGDYTFYVARNAHDRSLPLTLSLNDGVTYEKDDRTEHEIENLFDDVGSRIPVYMSRSDFDGTFPALPSDEMRTLSADDLAAVNRTYTDSVTDPWYSGDMPEQSDVALSYEETTVKLYDLIGKSYNDPLWNELLDQLTVAQMRKLIEIGNYHTEAIENIDKPQTIDPDGPMGYSLFMGNDAVYDTCYYASESLVASTWNTDLAERFGVMIGNESLVGNEKGDGRTYAGWYAPAVNLHRSPFGGRNFEYYSEDPVLSAKMAVGVIRGAKSKGVYTYLKHFALNDQETNRDTNGIAVWANEQTMRELYFLPFEKAVKEGGTTAMMSSFNRIGFTWAGGDYRLLTELLRDEWGFRGMVVTDYNLPTYMNVDQMIRAGGDLNLSQSKALKSYESATAVTAIRNATKNILYTVANSNAMNGVGEGNLWGYASPVWFIWMWTVFAVITAGLLVWGGIVCARVIVGYRAGVRAGTIVPAKKTKEKDPNYRPTVWSRVFLAALSVLAVCGVVLSSVLMSVPPSADTAADTFAPYIGGITLTLNHMPIENDTVSLEVGSDDNRLTVLVDAYGMASDGVTYVSGDPDIVEVGNDGALTAKAVGECAVTVCVNADPSVSGTVLVRVTDSGAATDTTPHRVTVVGGYANVSEAVGGTTVVLTAAAAEGMTFIGWTFDTEVEAVGNMFVMPAGDVTATAQYERNVYTLTLEGAVFANGSASRTLSYGDPIPDDIRVTAEIGEDRMMFGWVNAATGETVETVPAGDVSVRPLILARGAALVMGALGYDYGSGSGPSAAGTTIGDVDAHRVTVAAGKDMLRIKNGGVTGADNDCVYVTVILRNDNDFAVTLKYEIESYGAIWGPEPMTLEADETVTFGIVVQGLASDQTPYHRILFPDGTSQDTTLSFCGFLMQPTAD